MAYCRAGDLTLGDYRGNNCVYWATAVMPKPLKVWVAYVTPEQQFYIEVPFQEHMTLSDAIEQSGIVTQVNLPEDYRFGIFGVKLNDPMHLLKAGDRIEIYRPLGINPKEIRRQRAAANPVGRYCRGNRFKQLKK